MRRKLSQFRKRIISLLAACAIITGGLLAFTAAPAMALGSGMMCMFDAPNGVPIAPGVSLGHVGWGFEIGSSGSWTFGATEQGDGSPSSTWIANGTTAQMLATFRNRNGGGYYTKYRCHATPDSSVGAASNQASTTKNNGYNGVTNNCLTKAVSIYNAYYQSSSGPMDSGVGVLPNGYFNNALSGYSWGPPANL